MKPPRRTVGVEEWMGMLARELRIAFFVQNAFLPGTNFQGEAKVHFVLMGGRVVVVNWSSPLPGELRAVVSTASGA